MRLDPATIPLLIGEARAVFGDNAELWLFGSRVNDAAKGGDIDLYVETEGDAHQLDHRLDYLLCGYRAYWAINTLTCSFTATPNRYSRSTESPAKQV